MVLPSHVSCPFLRNDNGFEKCPSHETPQFGPRKPTIKAHQAPHTMSAPQGLQVTAGKVHVPFKTELLSTLSSPRFASRPPHLVGILATLKEDARMYAEVSADLR